MHYIWSHRVSCVDLRVTRNDLGLWSLIKSWVFLLQWHWCPWPSETWLLNKSIESTLVLWCMFLKKGSAVASVVERSGLEIIDLLGVADWLLDRICKRCVNLFNCLFLRFICFWYRCLRSISCKAQMAIEFDVERHCITAWEESHHMGRLLRLHWRLWFKVGHGCSLLCALLSISTAIFAWTTTTTSCKYRWILVRNTALTAPIISVWFNRVVLVDGCWLRCQCRPSVLICNFSDLGWGDRCLHEIRCFWRQINSHYFGISVLTSCPALACTVLFLERKLFGEEYFLGS